MCSDRGSLTWRGLACAHQPPSLRGRGYLRAVRTFFLVMFATCSMALLYYLVRLFQHRKTHAPDSATHQAFLDEMERSVWRKLAKQHGFGVEVREPEVLLCQHTLRGPWRQRDLRIQVFDRGHAGRNGQPSALRIAARQKAPELGLELSEGLGTAVVHGAHCVTYTGDRLLGMGPWLGEKAVRLRHEDDWLEIEARATPEQLPERLDQVLALFSELERASHPQWVEAAQDHGLELAWEGLRRHPRLIGVLAGGGIRVSVLEGQGVQVVWVGEAELDRALATLPDAELKGDTLRWLLPQASPVPLSQALGALESAVMPAQRP